MDLKNCDKIISMKTMTCKQLGGACDEVFQASTFEEMAKLSQEHAHKMYEAKDADHLKVMTEMMELMKDPKAMQEWMDGKKREFEELPKNQ
jgi:hypothetical protein